MLHLGKGLAEVHMYPPVVNQDVVHLKIGTDAVLLLLKINESIL